MIDEFLGVGWEGEVYRVVEELTGIVRAAKFFYPERNIGNKTLRMYAQKLENLAFCPLVIRYSTHERCRLQGESVDYFVSEFGEGEILCNFVRRQPGRHLTVYEAFHLLRELAAGLEMIHNAGEYHGDLHDENILVRRRGVRFQLKLIDFFHRGRLTRQHITDDVCDSVRIFYEALGGARRYKSLPPEAKYICCGLKRGLILRKFRSAGALKLHLDTFDWDG